MISLNQLHIEIVVLSILTGLTKALHRARRLQESFV